MYETVLGIEPLFSVAVGVGVGDDPEYSVKTASDNEAWAHSENNGTKMEASGGRRLCIHIS